MVDLEEIKQVRDTAELLYTGEEVEQAISRLAVQIIQGLEKANPVILCVLNGGIIVTGKILPRLPFLLELDSVHVTRYLGETRGSKLHWLHEPNIDLSRRSVLILDDVLDEGITLAAIRSFCIEQGAKEVKIGVLVDKKLSTHKPCDADYVGLVCGNHYIFGYGMDYKGYLRNMPGIYACREGQ